MFLAFGHLRVTDELWMLSTSGLSSDSKYGVSGVNIRTFGGYSFLSMMNNTYVLAEYACNYLKDVKNNKQLIILIRYSYNNNSMSVDIL